MNRIYITFFFLGFCTIFLCCQESPKQKKKDLNNSHETEFSSTLEHKLRMPISTTKGQIPLLVLMHGLGSNEDDLFSFASHMDKKLLIATVRAPYEIGPKKYSWYDFDRNGGNFVFSYAELQKSQSKLMQFIEDIQERYNIDKDKIFVGGFSQGAIMSLAAALNHSNKIAGAMVLSGDLLDEIENELSNKSINEDLKIYMSHGRLDNVLSFAEAQKDAKFLSNLNIQFESHWFDSKHSISRENFISLNQWLSSQLN